MSDGVFGDVLQRADSLSKTVSSQRIVRSNEQSAMLGKASSEATAVPATRVTVKHPLTTSRDAPGLASDLTRVHVFAFLTDYFQNECRLTL